MNFSILNTRTKTKGITRVLLLKRNADVYILKKFFWRHLVVETKTEFRKRALHFGRVLIINQESTSLAFLRSLHPKKTESLRSK